jgi:hypothetical protein
MKTLLYIAVYFILCFTSCGQKNCKPTDYHSIRWQSIDSITSFYLCSNSDTKLNSNDFVEIEYLGTLQKDDNILVQKEGDKAILLLLTNSNFGRFKLSDTTLSKNIRYVIDQLTTKSEATIKICLGNFKLIEFDKKITVYFKNNIDSTTAIKWINEIKTKPYVDSTYYISKDAALESFSKDLTDSTWLTFLKNNPLPTSVDIFIKPSYFDTIFIRKLKDELMKSNPVSDIVFSNNTAQENLNEFTQMLTNTYLIRIRPKE